MIELALTIPNSTVIAMIVGSIIGLVVSKWQNRKDK